MDSVSYTHLNTGTLLLILAVAVLGGGAGWYFKIYQMCIRDRSGGNLRADK